MGKKWLNIITALGALIAGALSFMLLERSQAFAYFYREQNQIFLLDWHDIFSRLMSPGGFVLVLSQFFVQFFKIANVGALITALLGLLTTLLLWKSLKNKTSLAALPLSLIPVFLQEGALSDTFYYYQGFVAFVLAALFLWLYVIFSSEKGTWFRMFLGTFLTLALYFIAGPVAFLLAICLAIFDVSGDWKHWYFALVPVVSIVICGWLRMRLGFVQDLKLALFQNGYYEPLLKPSAYIHASWIALPVIILISCGVRFFKTKMFETALAVVALVLSLVTLFRIPSHIDKKYYDSLRLSHYINEEDWDSILSDRTSTHMNYILMNIRNLALSRKGMLLDRLFDYPQKGILSLLAENDQSDQNTDMTVLHSHIYYAMGSTAPAQNKAFDSSVGIRFGNPYMIMRLIKTNLVWGAWDVAEKYISMMEKTLFYRGQAREFRRFLNDDASVLSDPELGRLRRGLTKRDYFSGMNPLADLELILEADPSDKAARDYYVSFMLLAKDIEGLRHYIENVPEAYDKQGNLHAHLQEAVMIYAEGDKEYCKAHGVTDETLNRYEAYRKQFISLKTNGGNPSSVMRSFAGTFWYYYMFINS